MRASLGWNGSTARPTQTQPPTQLIRGSIVTIQLQSQPDRPHYCTSTQSHRCPKRENAVARRHPSDEAQIVPLHLFCVSVRPQTTVLGVLRIKDFPHPALVATPARAFCTCFSLDSFVCSVSPPLTTKDTHQFPRLVLSTFDCLEQLAARAGFPSLQPGRRVQLPIGALLRVEFYRNPVYSAPHSLYSSTLSSLNIEPSVGAPFAAVASPSPSEGS
ncbi:uncharacterized protein BJ171DRAFT_54004 [Polychytrium aggregatum]|uniref:uncharacterized protein n=1 Tax=Polychytrium aggregatum TaxID=110093 RepID=UPI0022FDFD03|nr:uncharacterized protein BJ171DRAFT_54004 [Polychytrium aggregatum]KAI9205848.1 hypothetical protein BJ171DRAFT_54004 [Polychytrium aggregatum]